MIYQYTSGVYCPTSKNSDIMQLEIYHYSKLVHHFTILLKTPALKILKNPWCGGRGNFSITAMTKFN